MWYWILYLLIAVWVFFDSRKRQNNAFGWAIGTFLLGPILLPIYLAKRYLKEGETREGGTAWNILKNFALFWTLTMFISAIASLIGVGGLIGSTENEFEAAGAVIGAGIGMAFLAAIWFFPMIIALVLGFFLKKSSIVEKGPTGKLAQESPENPPVTA